MTVIDQLNQAQERIITEVQLTQARVVEANERFLEAAGNWIPKVEVPAIDSLPKLGDLPKREELVASYFDFASKMLDANRAFVEQMMGLWNRPVAQPAKTTRARAKASS